MHIVQFVFGLAVIAVFLLALLATLHGTMWVILYVVRVLPLVGRRHRYTK